MHASIFSYIGGAVKGLGPVIYQPEYSDFMLDFLIKTHDHATAKFFKGFMHKYGIRTEFPANLTIAKPLLEEAAGKGVGGALIELREFDMHVRHGVSSKR